MVKILVVGCGQLGSRYLQGINNLNFKCDIIVIDNSDHSILKAQEIWKNIVKNKNFHKILWKKQIPKYLSKIDLAIIATSSFERGKLIYNISKKVKVRYWIIEKIVAQCTKELKLIKKSTLKAKAAFINTPRRTMKWYKTLKLTLNKKNPFLIEKKGKLWNLASNAIHFIDLVSWMTNEKLVNVDTSQLSKKWIKSKRKGYFEISGKLKLSFSGGTILQLNSSTSNQKDTLTIKSFTGEKWKIYENTGNAILNNGNILNGRVEFQSQMTKPLLENLLINGDCELPTIIDSFDQHKIFIETMLNHWNKSNGVDDKIIPIT